MGQVFLVSFTFITSEVLPCDGRLLPISTNSALFSLLGTRFGGNGSTTFALPDLRNITPPGMMYVIVVNGLYPSRP